MNGPRILGLYRVFLLWICLLSTNSLFGQSRIVINNEDELLEFWNNKICEHTEKTVAKSGAAISFKGDKKLINIAKQVLDLERKKRDASDSLNAELFQGLAGELEIKNYRTAEAYVLYRLGRALYERGKSIEGLESILHAKEILNDEHKGKRFPQIASFYYYLGRIYIDYGDSKLALDFLHKATQNSFCKLEDEYYCWGNIGLTYFNLGNTDKALEASKKALTIIRDIGDKAEIASMMGNIGTIYLKHGDHRNALQYLEADYQGSLNHQKWESAVAVLIMKAKSYNALKRYDSARQVLYTADSISNACKCLTYAAKKEYYEQLAKFYSVKKEWSHYADAIDSFIHYSDRLNNSARDNTSNFLGTELRVAGKVHNTKMKLVESERQRQLLVRNFIIIVCILILLIVLFFWNNQRAKRKVELQIYQLNLENARKQLDAYLENIRNKNQLLEELQQKLEDSILKKSVTEGGNAFEERELELMAKLENASLITDEGWQEFTALVEQVHQHFFTKLNLTFCNLTPAEVRLITLIKLKFSIKESAAMLGISADSVRKARYRLRKKLSLEDENSLEELINDI